MPYLVDTDILIDVARGDVDAIDFLDRLPDSWSVFLITALELIVGARDKREVEQIEQLIAVYSAIPLNDAIGRLSYNLLKEYARSHGLRVMDSLIAATALTENLILATRNKKHFQMIGNLRLEIPQY
jgi:predicted nucleic acid-binding protein